MGLWNFVKDSGKKLFGGKEEAPDAETLKKEIKELGLDTGDLDISVEGDKVKVSGMGMAQELKEKVILAVGNIAGVSAVEADGGDEGAVFHTVKSGENLSVIAQKTLGKASKYHEIFEANKPMLTHPDKIYPGQVLRIPQSTEA